jgi:metal-sulfur cluster biosynthetic enzyme
VASESRADTTAARPADAEAAIRDALRTVYDPCCRERGISIVDMGLVRSIDLGDGRPRVELILTSGWCPFASRVLDEVRQKVQPWSRTGEVAVEVTWDEPWTMDRLSAEARAKLRFLPEPSEVSDRQRYISERRGLPPSPRPSPAEGEGARRGLSPSPRPSPAGGEGAMRRQDEK